MSDPLARKRLDVVDRLRVRYPDVLEAVSTYLLRSTTDQAEASDVQLEWGWREVAGACLHCGLLAIEQGDEWSGPVPPIVVVQEHRAVRSGIDLPTSMDRYTSAYRLAWDYVLEEIGHSDIPDQDRMPVQRQASRASLSLLSRLLSEIAKVHIELKDAMRTSGHNDVKLACRILAGEPVDRREIDYDFEAEHVGLIAWGEDAAATLESVAVSLGYKQWIVPHQDGTAWAWLSRGDSCSAEDIASALGSDGEVFAAIGKPAPLLAGFRDTHRLAQAAHRVAKLSGQRITQYEHVTREARALQDPAHARWLIRNYIIPVLEHREAVALRETLEKFYETGRNAEKAGKLVGVDRHTVNRRVEKVGELIGRELRTCHADMEVALSLAKLYEQGDVAPLAIESRKGKR